MSELEQLQREIQAIRDIEAIKVLKARYIRHMALNQWDELEALMTEDAESAYSDGKYTFNGRAALMNFLREANSTGQRQISWWLVGMPEITLHDATHASGIWGMLHFHLDKQAQHQVDQFSYYEDEYVKVDGAWKIRRTGYRSVMEENIDRGLLPEGVFQLQVG